MDDKALKAVETLEKWAEDPSGSETKPEETEPETEEEEIEDDEDEVIDEEEVEEEGDESDEEEVQGEDEGEEVEDEDAEEDEEFSAEDLKKLTMFPKEVRSSVAKMDKAAQSKLVSWITQQNEDKRKVTAEAKSMKDTAEKQEKTALDLRKSLSEDWTKIAEALNKGKGKLAEDDRKLIENVIDVHKAAIVANYNTDFQAHMKLLVDDTAPDVAAFLKDNGLKPDVWSKKHPEEANLLIVAAMLAKKEERRSRLKKLIPMIEHAGKASAQKKTRPRPAQSSKSSKSRLNRNSALQSLESMATGAMAKEK